ncbi:hypothetical protein V6N12_046192 [Hibiscus sabdariffa]|uniref:Uncharacterized protein n=1 Tax=Hibiscus sabdariffa TaxID=183260 RepID=A0ABR2AQ43_9ROSI
MAETEEQDSEPEGGAFHEEPIQRRNGGTPAEVIVLAIKGLQELKADPCWLDDELNGFKGDLAAVMKE